MSNISKVTDIIGGITIYAYNTDVLESYIKDSVKRIHSLNPEDKRKDADNINVNVLYLVHPRGQNYKVTENIAYNIVEQFNNKKKSDVPLIAVTFDNRNHGERLIDDKRNQSWRNGNDKHALDLVSDVYGGVQDLKLIIDYFPGILNLDQYITSSAKENGTKISFRNAVSGYSLGAHIAIRFGYYHPELVEIINPVIGCPDLSSLLINRLQANDIDSNSYDVKWFYKTYEELNFTPEQKSKQYPEYIHKILSAEDVGVFEDYPFQKIKLFASFGEHDKLVPPKLARSWIEIYKNTNSDSETYLQKGAGHEVTPESLDAFTSWLVKYF